MSTIEFVTVTISSIAIGASVVSILLFVLFVTLQKKLVIRPGESTKVTRETAWTMEVYAESLREDVPEASREVLSSLIERYSETSLTGVLDDPIERMYLFKALHNPSQLPWESEGQRGERSK